MPTRAIGNDGSITLPSGFSGVINQWNASISRVSSAVPDFGDTGMSRRYGIQDMTGAATGHPHFGQASTAPGAGSSAVGGITLLIATGCSYASDVGVQNTALSSNKVGDATLAFNFEMAGGAAVVETWATT